MLNPFQVLLKPTFLRGQVGTSQIKPFAIIIAFRMLRTSVLKPKPIMLICWVFLLQSLSIASWKQQTFAIVDFSVSSSQHADIDSVVQLIIIREQTYELTSSTVAKESLQQASIDIG